MLTRTGMGVGSVIFPRTEPMRGHYTFHISKSRFFMRFQTSAILLGLSMNQGTFLSNKHSHFKEMRR